MTDILGQVSFWLGIVVGWVVCAWVAKKSMNMELKRKDNEYAELEKTYDNLYELCSEVCTENEQIAKRVEKLEGKPYKSFDTLEERVKKLEKRGKK